MSKGELETQFDYAVVRCSGRDPSEDGRCRCTRRICQVCVVENVVEQAAELEALAFSHSELTVDSEVKRPEPGTVDGVDSRRAVRSNRIYGECSGLEPGLNFFSAAASA